MIRLEIVHLLPKHELPEVLAQKLDHVERVVEAWAVAGESGHVSISTPYTREREKEKKTNLSTNPCPTRYPSRSNRKNTASRSSSSSIAVIVPDTTDARFPAAPASPAPAPAAAGSGTTTPEVAAAAASTSCVTRYAMGTSSMRRKSRHEEERKRADGSEALYGGITASKDMLAVVEGDWLGDCYGWERLSTMGGVEVWDRDGGSLGFGGVVWLVGIGGFDGGEVRRWGVGGPCEAIGAVPLSCICWWDGVFWRLRRGGFG